MSDHVVAASDGDVQFEGSEYMFGFKLLGRARRNPPPTSRVPEFLLHDPASFELLPFLRCNSNATRTAGPVSLGDGVKDD